MEVHTFVMFGIKQFGFHELSIGADELEQLSTSP